MGLGLATELFKMKATGSEPELSFGADLGLGLVEGGVKGAGGTKLDRRVEESERRRGLAMVPPG
jgi:hypothetical protein